MLNCGAMVDVTDILDLEDTERSAPVHFKNRF
jgi:hypothetical protein